MGLVHYGKVSVQPWPEYVFSMIMFQHLLSMLSQAFPANAATFVSLILQSDVITVY